MDRFTEPVDLFSARRDHNDEYGKHIKSVPFLDSPEVVWREPLAEQVLTHMGNGTW